MLHSVYNSLKNNGTLICEFGAKNNISQIETAFKKVIEQMGYSYFSPFFFPSKEEYKSLLNRAGFEVKHIIEYDRPTSLADGEKGLRIWISQFFASDLLKFSDEQKEEILLKQKNFAKIAYGEMINGQLITSVFKLLQLKKLCLKYTLIQ